MTAGRDVDRKDLVVVAASSDAGPVRALARLFPDEALCVSVHGAFLVLARSVLSEAGISDLYRHEAVASAVAQKVPVVPVPYGFRLPGPAQLVSTLFMHEAQLLSALEQVRGQAELGVTVTRTAPVPAPEDTYQRGAGRTYLESLLGPQRQADAGIAAVNQVLAQLGAQVVERPLPRNNRFLFRASCLVRAEHVEQVQRGLRAIQLGLQSTSSPGRMALFVTGPWAPYTFTSHELLTGRGSALTGDQLEDANV